MVHPREDPESTNKNYQDSADSSGNSLPPRENQEISSNEQRSRADSRQATLYGVGTEPLPQEPGRTDPQSRAHSPLNYLGTSAPPQAQQHHGTEPLPVSPLMALRELSENPGNIDPTQNPSSSMGAAQGLNIRGPDQLRETSQSQHRRSASGQPYAPVQSAPIMPLPYQSSQYAAQYRYPQYGYPPNTGSSYPLPEAQDTQRVAQSGRPQAPSGDWSSHTPQTNLNPGFEPRREQLHDPGQLQEWYEGQNTQSPESSGTSYVDSGSSTESGTPIGEPGRERRQPDQRVPRNPRDASRAPEPSRGRGAQSQQDTSNTLGLSGASDYQEIIARFPSLTGYINIPPNGPGQQQPPRRDNDRMRTSTMSWEDEGTLCIVVEVNGTAIARRCDNNMINGTKLLNVASMTRGRRDGILKGERIRHVVKIGQMYLKGVWIPFERALEIARRERLVDKLYPLFISDLGVVLYAHNNLPRTRQVIIAAYHKTKDERFRDWINGIPRQRQFPGWTDESERQQEFSPFDDRRSRYPPQHQQPSSQQHHLAGLDDQLMIPSHPPLGQGVDSPARPQPGNSMQRTQSHHQIPEDDRRAQAGLHPYYEQQPPLQQQLQQQRIQQQHEVDPRLASQGWGRQPDVPYHAQDYTRTGKQQSRRQSRHDPYVRGAGSLHSRTRSNTHIPPMPYPPSGSYANANYPMPNHLQPMPIKPEGHAGGFPLEQRAISDEGEESGDESEESQDIQH